MRIYIGRHDYNPENSRIAGHLSPLRDKLFLNSLKNNDLIFSD